MLHQRFAFPRKGAPYTATLPRLPGEGNVVLANVRERFPLDVGSTGSSHRNLFNYQPQGLGLDRSSQGAYDMRSERSPLPDRGWSARGLLAHAPSLSGVG